MTFLGLLIPLLPLMGFLVNGLLGKYLPKGSTGWIGSLSVLASFICVLMIFKDLGAAQAIQIDVFNWISFGNIDISFGLWIDSLTMVMLMVMEMKATPGSLPTSTSLSSSCCCLSWVATT